MIQRTVTRHDALATSITATLNDIYLIEDRDYVLLIETDGIEVHLDERIDSNWTLRQCTKTAKKHGYRDVTRTPDNRIIIK